MIIFQMSQTLLVRLSQLVIRTVKWESSFFILSSVSSYWFPGSPLDPGPVNRLLTETFIGLNVFGVRRNHSEIYSVSMCFMLNELCI